MNSITITVDTKKLDRSKVREYTYQKQGMEAVAREIKLDVVELKEPRIKKQGDTWEIVETHFVAEFQTKEERQAKTPRNYVGSGSIIRDRNPATLDTMNNPIDF